MSDIAQRLREGIDPTNIPEGERAMDAGADEIERLTERLKRVTDQRVLLSAEVERLTAALKGSESIKHGYLDEVERLKNLVIELRMDKQWLESELERVKNETMS